MSDEQGQVKMRARHGPPIPDEGWKRALAYLAFFGFFFGAIFLVELYVLTRLFTYLGLRHGWPFLLFVVLSSVSFVGAMGLRAATSRSLTKAYYYGSATWLGFIILFLFASLICDILAWFVAIPGDVRIVVFVGGTAALVVIALVVPFYVKKRYVTIPAKRLAKDVRVAHMTDIHVGAAHGPERLRELVEIVNGMEPDLVLITGDLADSPLVWSENPFAALDDLKAPTYFTIGNHEYYAGIEEVTGYVARTKVKVLRNEVVQANGIQIIGLDYGNAADLKAALPKLSYDRSKYTLLMYHNPDGIREAHEGGVDLVVSGHTHGGQFFPFTLTGRLLWDTFSGLYEHKGTYHWVSTGVGTWGPPLRLGTRSEVVLLTLKSGKHGGVAATVRK